MNTSTHIKTMYTETGSVVVGVGSQKVGLGVSSCNARRLANIR